MVPGRAWKSVYTSGVLPGPMHAPDTLDVLVTLLISCGLGGAAYARGVLSWLGTILAATMGMVIGLSAGWEFVALLLLYLVTSFAVTLYGYSAKKAAGVAEGKKGERGWRSVLANGFVPSIIAFLHLFDIPGVDRWVLSMLFVTAIAAAAADTAASELGVLTRDPVLITRPRQRVRPGTNGGISTRGQFFALAAAFYTVVMGAAVFTVAGTLHDHSGQLGWTGLTLIAPVAIAMGFVSCQIDSLLGATLENRGHISKNGVNLVSIAVTSVLTLLLLLLLT